MPHTEELKKIILVQREDAKKDFARLPARCPNQSLRPNSPYLRALPNERWPKLAGDDLHG